MADSITDRAFFDTNVLVYAFDADEPQKQAVAQSLLADTPIIVISGQVLGELYWTVTRKLLSPLEPDHAQSLIEWFSQWVVVPIDQRLVQSAVELSRSASIAYWDALIVRAASTAGCRQLLTEDLNPGQVIGGVEVVNPFAGL